jgi:Nickel responsive protein SCO4226-like
MKAFFVFATIVFIGLFPPHLSAQTNQSDQSKKNRSPKHLYLDVHHIGPGKVTAKDAAGAHQKDLAIQNKYGVNFIKYWVDEANGNIYCLAEAADSQSIRKTHAEAHGLVPDQVQLVTGGEEASINGKKDLYLDLHVMGAGKVNASAVEGAHQKDLAVQKKHGVSFIKYWVDEKNGTVMCLAQAPNADSVINTHKEAHGLVPVKVDKVKQGH